MRSTWARSLARWATAGMRGPAAQALAVARGGEPGALARAYDLPPAGEMPGPRPGQSAEDLNPGTEWLLDAEPQARLTAVYAELEATGADTNLLGVFIHWQMQKVFFVTDPDLDVTSEAGIAAVVRAAGGPKAAAIRGCASGAALKAALQAVLDDAALWAAGLNSARIDPAVGAVRVGADDVEKGKASLPARHARHIVVEWSERLRPTAGGLSPSVSDSPAWSASS